MKTKVGKRRESPGNGKPVPKRPVRSQNGRGRKRGNSLKPRSKDTRQDKVLDQAQEKARHFEVLNTLVKKANSTPRLPDLLQFIADSARDLLGVARTNILLANDTFTYLTQEARSGVGATGSLPEKKRLQIGKAGLYAKRIHRTSPFYVADILRHPDLVNRKAYEKLGFRSCLIVPLLIGESPIGAISCFTQTPRRFSKDEVELVKLFADHAALAVERARLLELVASEAQQSGLVARVTKAVNSISDLDELLDVIGKEIKALVGFDHANILLPDEVTGSLRRVPIWGRMLRSLNIPIKDSCPDQVLRTGRPWIRQDLKTDKRKFAEDADLIRLGVRSSLVVPLVSHKTRIGSLNLTSRQPNHFTPRHIALLSLITDPIAIAMDRAQHHESTLKELKKRKALSESARKITSELDLKKVLDSIVKESLDVLGVDRCAILLVDEGDDSLKFAASSGLSRTYRETLSRAWKNAPEKLPDREDFLKGREIITSDVCDEPGLKPVLDLILREGYRSVATFPLRSGRKVLGGLAVFHDQPRTYSQSDRQLARTFASHAAIAMERARHHESILKELRKRKALSLSARKITFELDLKKVLDSIVEESLGILGPTGAPSSAWTRRVPTSFWPRWDSARPSAKPSAAFRGSARESCPFERPS